MKKLLSMLMVIAVFFSVITVPVKANPTTGSITISNATKEKEYKVYKIFDALINFKDGKADGVSYKLEREGNEVIYDELFGADGKKENKYFQYNPSSDEVRAIGTDTEIYTYLAQVIKNLGGKYNPTQTATATDSTLVFSGLPFGYYLITSSLGTTVTINSTAPDVTVIDKNQVPGTNFDKQVQTGTTIKDGVEIPTWGDQNSANIGDLVNYKVNFDATNYDGMNKIQYYQIHDEKGDALWIEFNSIRVFVGGTELKHGYYLCQGNANELATDNWEYLGDWSDIPEADRDMNDAQWYLVHLGYDQFRITIPWLEGHKITKHESWNAKNELILNYTLSYDDVEDAASLYESPSQVEVYYDAAVEHNANIGGVGTNNLFNKANATWTFTGDTKSTHTETVDTKVYGIGITKKDGSDQKTNLAGAQFEIYRDQACTDKVYVIPTNTEGVYIVDSLNTALDGVTGINKETAREIYSKYLDAYLAGETQKSLVTSQVNGKLVVLGLAEGTYYFKEVKAPTGYNTIADPILFTVSSNNSIPFTIYADSNGKVSNITQTEGEYAEVKFSLVSDTVYNGKGQTLPTTGAEGTIKLITIGSFITIACAVLLVTQKKMSIYRD